MRECPFFPGFDIRFAEKGGLRDLVEVLMEMTWAIVDLVGRIFFGLCFLVMGFGHLRNRAAMTGYAQSKKVPAAGPVVIITGIMLIVGALSLILGILPVVGALLIIIFLAPTTFVMHAFWRETDPEARMNESIMFFKDLALLGAALMVLAMVAWGASDPDGYALQIWNISLL